MNDWTWILIPARQLLSVCGIGVMGLHPLHFDKRLARLVSKCKARDTVTVIGMESYSAPKVGSAQQGHLRGDGLLPPGSRACA